MNEHHKPEAANRVVEFARGEIDRYAGYQRHKESMAYTGLALLAGVSGFVLTSTNWPPQEWGCYRQLFGGLALTGLWAAMLVYLRFQLRNRRWAALRVAGCERVLVSWATDKLDYERLGAARRSQIEESATWRRLLDWIWPQEMCLPAMKNLEKDYYPGVLVDAWEEVEKSGTAAIENERLIFVTGWTLFFLTIVRTWLAA